MSRSRFLLTLALTALTVAIVAADEMSGGWLLPLRAPLALFFLLFVPGYALQAVLSPRSSALTSLEQSALSVGLSAALLAPLVLILDSLGWGIRLWPILLSLSILTLLFAALAFLRGRRALPAEHIPPAPMSLRAWWQAQSTRQRRLTLAALGLVSAVSLYAIFWLALPHAENYFTEFYLLGSGGAAEAYPQRVRMGQPLNLSLGVTNRERQDETYLIIAKSGEHIVGYHEPFSVPRAQSFSLTLPIIMPAVGEKQRVDIALIRPQETTPYRQLILWLDVEP